MVLGFTLDLILTQSNGARGGFNGVTKTVSDSRIIPTHDKTYMRGRKLAGRQKSQLGNVSTPV